MKAFLRVLTAIALLSVVGLRGVVASQPEGADIELSTAIIDLGTLSQDDDRQIVRLKYTNTGDLPLVITEVRTSCSCTTVEYERGKVLPGEHRYITITMNPAKVPEGQYLRVMQIFSTAKSGTKRVTIKAVIE